jgi:hypothetical protein
MYLRPLLAQATLIPDASLLREASLFAEASLSFHILTNPFSRKRPLFATTTYYPLTFP